MQPSILSRRGYWRTTLPIFGQVSSVPHIGGVALSTNGEDLILQLQNGTEFVCKKANFSREKELFRLEEDKIKFKVAKSERQRKQEQLLIEYV